MILKKVLMLTLTIVFLSLITAENYKIDISLAKETFEADENINFIINLYDENDNLLEDNIFVVLESINKEERVEQDFISKKLSNINLGKDAPAGEWRITAEYQNAKATESFFIKADEKLNISIENNILKIKNIGNIKYEKEIEIKIGSESTKKNIGLNPEEEIKYRLIAPEGNYVIKIISDGNSIYSKENIQLTGEGLTGEAIGVIDESASQRNSITGGISPEEDSDSAMISYIKNSKFTYVFIMVIFGAMILLAIERRSRKK